MAITIMGWHNRRAEPNTASTVRRRTGCDKIEFLFLKSITQVYSDGLIPVRTGIDTIVVTAGNSDERLRPGVVY